MLRANVIFNDSGLVLIAIESVDFRYSHTNAVFRMRGEIEPIVVIVCASGATFAVDIQAKPVDLEQFRQDIPQLDAILALYDKH